MAQGYQALGGKAALVGSIYDAALDARRWGHFLDHFSVALDSPAAMIWAQDFGSNSVDVDGHTGAITAARGIDPAAMATFSTYYSQRNVWLEDQNLHQSGKVVIGSQLFPDAQLERTEWYADCLRPQDLFHTSAAVVERRHDQTFNVTAVRSKAAGNYTPHELQLLADLMPHLQSAFALHRRLHRLEALSQTSMALLEGLPMGVVLLDEHACVLHANKHAHRLARTTGLLLFGEGSRLHAASNSVDQALQQAMTGAVRTGAGKPASAGDAFHLDGLDGVRLQVLVAPLPSWNSPFGAHAAAVFISDPTAMVHSFEAIMRSLYRLTNAEARLAQALINGLTPTEYAQQNGLSVHTVRTQFKSAAAKVGVSRQADFVRAILTGPAMLQWQRAEPGAAGD